MAVEFHFNLPFFFILGIHLNTHTQAAHVNRSRSLNTVFAVVGSGCEGSVVVGGAVVATTGLNSFQGLVGQLRGVRGVVPMLSLDSSEDSLTFVFEVNFLSGIILRGDQPGGRLHLDTL